jgi:hypothetical protein
MKMTKPPIGYSCQHCGVSFCKACQKKHVKLSMISGWKKVQCPQCGNTFGPGHVFQPPEAPLSVALPEPIWLETAPTDEIASSQIVKSLDEREWESNADVREQLLDLLKIHGRPFLGETLKDIIVGSQLSRKATNSKINRIGSLAEAGALWLFEDGVAEEWLIIKIEHDKRNPTRINDDLEHPETATPHITSALLSIETATKSGRSIPTLINKLLNDKSEYYRADTAEKLGVVDWDPRVVDALIEALGDTGRPRRTVTGLAPKRHALSVQERSVQSLMKIDDERGLSAVYSLLIDQDKFARSTDLSWDGIDTEEMFSEFGMKAVPFLIKTLQDEDANRRKRAASALGNIRAPESVTPLINLLDDKDRGVRQCAAMSLGQIGDVRALAPLLQLLKDKNMFVRNSAQTAIKQLILGREEDHQVQEPLIKALDDKDARVRLFAVQSVGDMNLEAAADSLNQALNDKDRKVRKAAKKSLSQIERGR